jgi:16S rRNA (uracil1498-N3)-methyltransferase
LARREVNRELSREFVLGVALPKGDRQRWLIEKAVELGVTRLIPLQTARGVAQPTDQALKRCRRTVIEASKQCGRNRLMDIAAAQPVTAFLAHAPQGLLRLVAHPGPGARPLSHVLAEVPLAPLVAAVGPEGGFTSAEIAAARDWQLVSLGPRILRVETAAVALAACVAACANDSRSGTDKRETPLT